LKQKNHTFRENTWTARIVVHGCPNSWLSKKIEKIGPVQEDWSEKVGSPKRLMQTTVAVQRRSVQEDRWLSKKIGIRGCPEKVAFHGYETVCAEVEAAAEKLPHAKAP
jgi:hypothetical protein